MIPQNFIYLAALINFFGFLSYLTSTLKGRTKPNRVTFFIWSLAPFIASAAQIASGVGLSTLGVFIIGFGPFLILLASFYNPNAYYQLHRMDYFCGFFAALGLIFWMQTKNANLAILCSIITEIFAAIPTFVKISKAPETENGLYYVCGLVGLVITFLCVQDKSFAGYAFISFAILMYALLAISVYGAQKLRSPQQSG